MSDKTVDQQSENNITISSPITVKELAARMQQPVGPVIAELMKNGILATLNENLDYDTAAIVASEFGFVSQEEQLAEDKPLSRKKRVQSSTKSHVSRPPVVAVMGHVDHGKTSLIDSIRGSHLTDKESGGITQHISAYHIEHAGRPITLLDTPGHEAFAALREHGAALTDVALLVVAADDGVKPQTKEAIHFAQRSGVPIIVALNKVDKPSVDLNKVKQELAHEGLNPEEWGGDTVIVPVSAKSKSGVDQLLDMLLLVSDIHELTAATDIPAEGVVIESHIAQGKGAVATLLVEQGTLHTGDVIIAGETYAKSRQLQDENNKVIETVGPSRAVSVSGFKAPPAFGNSFRVVASEREARRFIAEQTSSHSTTTSPVLSTHELLKKMEQKNQQKTLNLILKVDVMGSLEAITKSLASMGNEEVHVKVVSSGVGNVSESDVSRAQATHATIIAFHVAVSSAVKRTAHHSHVTMKLYQVVYELLDDVKSMLEQLMPPEVVETTVGDLLIKGIFRQTSTQTICGGEVLTGKVIPGLIAQVIQGDEVIAESQVEKVQREQQEVKEVVAGELCGIELSSKRRLTLKEGDKLRFIIREERQKQL